MGDNILTDRRFFNGVCHEISAIFLIILLFIFIYRLAKFDILCDGVRKGFEDTIVKNAITGLLPPIITTILSFVMIICALIKFYPPIQVFHALMLLDIITKSVCLLLSYQYFETEYKFCCKSVANLFISKYNRYKN